MISVRADQDLFTLARRLRAQGSEGLLVSGGSTRTGEVPLLPHLRHIPRIRSELGMKVIVHSGVVSPRLAAGLAQAGVDGVMLDIIGADETLRDVYHLDLTVADMDNSLRLLSGEGLRIIPHIVLGLHYGRFLGEHAALEMLTRYPVSTLILVVLTPLTGTPMAAHPAAARRRGRRVLRHRPAGRPGDAGQPRLRPPARQGQVRPRPGGHRPRAERHRLPGRRGDRVRAVPRPDAAPVRVLLLAHLDGGQRGQLREGRGARMTWFGRAATGEPWRLLADDGAGAADGLALDEALMARYARDEPPRPPTLRLYTYRTHCALIGRYQNLDAEVDLAACRETGTQVSRRPTGGGAIIMGAGQLGVALASAAPPGRRPREIIEDLAGGLMAGLPDSASPRCSAARTTWRPTGARSPASACTWIRPGRCSSTPASWPTWTSASCSGCCGYPAAKLADKAAAAVAERVTTVTELTGRPWDGAALRPVIAAGFAAAFGAGLQPAEPGRRRADALPPTSPPNGMPASPGSPTAAPPWTAAARRRSRHRPGSPRIYLTTHGDLVKNAIVVGDFNELPAAVTAMESALRWRRLDDRTVGDAVARSGAGQALGVPAGQLVAAVLDAGPAGQRAARRRARPIRGLLLLPRDRRGMTWPSASYLCSPRAGRGPPLRKISPDYVRISYASAIALRMTLRAVQPGLRVRRHQPAAELRRGMPVRLRVLRPGPHQAGRLRRQVVHPGGVAAGRHRRARRPDGRA